MKDNKKRKEIEKIKEKFKKKIKSLKKKGLQHEIIIKKFRTLIEVNSIITSSLDKKIVLKNILDQTKILMQCNKSSILLIDKETNELKFAVFSNEEDWEHLKNFKLKIGEGIAGTVWKTGTPLLIKDACKDSRFSDKADKKTRSVTTSLIAVPLVVDGKIIGVMEAINKKNDKRFNSFDLNIFKNLSYQAAVSIENANLYELAITDGLTRLFIHRYFQQRLEEEFNRAIRYKSHLSIIMFDMDYFKKLNDTYGHQAGDEVLILTAKLIKKNCRLSDIPCRYGGEEMCVILPETNLDGAVIFANKVRKRIKDMQIEYDGRTIKLTISAGVASIKEDNPKTKSEFISIADKALYLSKRNGRNRVSTRE